MKKRKTKTSINDFTLIRKGRMINSNGELGKGSYGRVMLAKYRKNSQLYAIKKISKKSMKQNNITTYIK